MQQSNQNMENKNNDLTEIITQVLNEMKMELGDSFDIDKVNLAELERRTGITRAKLRRIKSNGFVDKPHAFLFMGVPRHVLTDNMKSVVTGRDAQGHPIWQKDYEIFMGNLCFETRLCKPRHPFTKGAVERLVRFVKENFLPGRIFNELTDLNYEAITDENGQDIDLHTPELLYDFISNNGVTCQKEV